MRAPVLNRRAARSKGEDPREDLVIRKGADRSGVDTGRPAGKKRSELGNTLLARIQ